MVERVTGIDYSFDRPSPAAIHAAGHSFVMRYVPYGGDGGKGLGAAEYESLVGAGLSVGLVWETTANRALDGYAAGWADATTAVTNRRVVAPTIPGTRPIFLAVDFDAQPHQFDRIGQYFAGAIAGIGLARVGVYGHDAILRYLAGANRASWYWQTYAWSYGRQFERNHVYQWRNGQTLDGAAVDYNYGYGVDYGQYPLPESGDEMGLTAEETRALLMREEIRALAGTLLIGAADPQLWRVERLHAELTAKQLLPFDWESR